MPIIVFDVLTLVNVMHVMFFTLNYYCTLYYFWCICKCNINFIDKIYYNFSYSMKYIILTINQSTNWITLRNKPIFLVAHIHHSPKNSTSLRKYIHKAPLPKNPNQKLEGSNTIFLYTQAGKHHKTTCTISSPSKSLWTPPSLTISDTLSCNTQVSKTQWKNATTSLTINDYKHEHFPSNHV